MHGKYQATFAVNHGASIGIAWLHAHDAHDRGADEVPEVQRRALGAGSVHFFARLVFAVTVHTSGAV